MREINKSQLAEVAAGTDVDLKQLATDTCTALATQAKTACQDYSKFLCTDANATKLYNTTYNACMTDFSNAAAKQGVKVSDSSDYSSDGVMWAGGDSGGCVHVDSLLPDGTKAGDIKVGSAMLLSDEKTLKCGAGVVSFSERKKAPGFRITTISGVTLVCSDSAPIPTPEGLVLAPALAGKSVAVRRDEGNDSRSSWEAVKSVESIGEIDIQHITVGNKCFWAGEKANGFILHHNVKNEGGAGGGYDYDESYDDYC
ncbi:MAG: hypothetical protein V4582_13660 [Pseudomonadota bacterium]